VLVADNEISGGLFSFRRAGDSLVDQQTVPLPAGLAPADIEALAVADGNLIVVGSMSRNKRCEVRLARQRILVMSWEVSRQRLKPVRLIDCAEAWKKAATTVEGCLKALFTDPPPALAQEVCASIVLAEQEARPGTRDCRTLNVEGAVAVPAQSPAGRERVWLGLRSPLVGSAAALLRLTPGLDAFRFDAVALVGFNDLGIRELALAEGRLWGIAGPAGDRPGDPHSLWSLPAASLAPGARLLPDGPPVALPASSEGMDFAGGSAIALIDGDYGGDGAPACLVPGRQITVNLPPRSGVLPPTRGAGRSGNGR
jgi:hypothetical protein